MSDGTPGFRSSSEDELQQTAKRKRLRKKKERKGRKKESDDNQEDTTNIMEKDENANVTDATVDITKKDSLKLEEREKVSSPSKRNSSKDKSMSGMKNRMSKHSGSLERRPSGSSDHKTPTDRRQSITNYEMFDALSKKGIIDTSVNIDTIMNQVNRLRLEEERDKNERKDVGKVDNLVDEKEEEEFEEVVGSGLTSASTSKVLTPKNVKPKTIPGKQFKKKTKKIEEVKEVKRMTKDRREKKDPRRKKEVVSASVQL